MRDSFGSAHSHPYVRPPTGGAQLRLSCGEVARTSPCGALSDRRTTLLDRPAMPLLRGSRLLTDSSCAADRLLGASGVEPLGLATGLAEGAALLNPVAVAVGGNGPDL